MLLATPPFSMCLNVSPTWSMASRRPVERLSMARRSSCGRHFDAALLDSKLQVQRGGRHALANQSCKSSGEAASPALHVAPRDGVQRDETRSRAGPIFLRQEPREVASVHGMGGASDAGQRVALPAIRTSAPQKMRAASIR